MASVLPGSTNLLTPATAFARLLPMTCRSCLACRVETRSRRSPVTFVGHWEAAERPGLLRVDSNCCGGCRCLGSRRYLSGFETVVLGACWVLASWPVTGRLRRRPLVYPTSSALESASAARGAEKMRTVAHGLVSVGYCPGQCHELSSGFVRSSDPCYEL